MTAPDPDDTIAYYKLDEISGTNAVDSTPNNLNGTANNARVFTSAISGIINTGADFTQGSDSIVIPHTGQFAFTDSSVFSVNVWFKTPTSGAQSQIIGMERLSTTGVLAWDITQLDGKIRYNVARAGVGNIKTIESGSTYNNNSWHMATIIYDNKAMELFINGVSQGTDTYASTGTGSTQDLALGARKIGSSLDFFFDGEIDEILIYDGILTPANISYLYASGNPGSAQQYPFITVTVTVDGKHILVEYPEGDEPTAEEVKTAIEEEPDANALVSVSFAAGQDGSGEITEMSETFLSGGEQYNDFSKPFVHPVSDEIKGVVSVQGTPQEGATVRLMNITDDSYVGDDLTDGNGEYSFDSLDDEKEYHVTAEFDVKATMTTNLTGSDNDLVFTSKLTGSKGNDISIEYREEEES
jgi:hypothetical protein